MRIIEINPKDNDFHLFSEVMLQLDYLPAQLKTKSFDLQNEFLHNLLVVLDDYDKPVGRLAIYNNPQLQYKNLHSYAIGGYECINDLNVSKLLFDKTFEMAKADNVQYLLGPMNGSTWFDYRYADHHDELFFSEVYHKDYYKNHFIQNGFDVIGSYYSSIDEILEVKNNTLGRELELTSDGLIFRNIDLNNYETELENIYNLCELAFKENFLFTSLSKRVFMDKYKSLIHFLNEELIIMAFDGSGNLVGFIFTFDDIYSTNKKKLVVKTLARHPDRKWMGLGNILSDKIQNLAVAKNYGSLIHSFMHNDGHSINLSKKYSSKPFKNYYLYGKKI